MSDFLAEMTAAACARVAAARERTPLVRPPHRGRDDTLRAALAGHAGAPASLAIIAEVKRSSPSKGDIAPGLDAAAQARAYAAAGVEAISVLTEPTRFGGSLDDLRAVAAAVEVPVLRKDFIVDPYQIWEAATAGASAVLLIAAALSNDDLSGLLAECRACGLDALLEVHDEDDLLRAELAGAAVIGVNNRDLRTLAVDLAVTERLVPLAAGDAVLVSESGIATPADARRARLAGAHAALIGEALVRAGRDSLPDLVRELRGTGTPGPGDAP